MSEAKQTDLGAIADFQIDLSHLTLDLPKPEVGVKVPSKIRGHAEAILRACGWLEVNFSYPPGPNRWYCHPHLGTKLCWRESEAVHLEYELGQRLREELMHFE